MDLCRRIIQLEAERDGWKAEAEKQIWLAKGAIEILEHHIEALMKERDVLKERLNSPLQ